jgi:hypothetical protein
MLARLSATAGRIGAAALLASLASVVIAAAPNLTEPARTEPAREEPARARLARPSQGTTPTVNAGPLRELLDRTAGYVASFVSDAAVLLAKERYVQAVGVTTGAYSRMPGYAGATTERRTLESEVALVHLTDQVWLIARDVVTLDGRSLPPSQRLPLTTQRPASLEAAIAAFREIARQGARFNIGGIRRDLNVPTLALWFLSDALRERFVYEPAGTDTIDGLACQIVAYTERARPWLLRADGRPVPVRGRVWIAAAGAVLKTELTLDDSRPESAINRSSAFAEPETGGGRAVIAVDYGFSEAVHAWVPREMRERYDHPGGVAITGRAEYGEYRRFTVDSRIVTPP